MMASKYQGSAQVGRILPMVWKVRDEENPGDEEPTHDSDSDPEGLNGWDPASLDFRSIQNLNIVDNETPGAFVKGKKYKADGWKDVICPFYTKQQAKNGWKHCFKGPACLRNHVIEEEMVHVSDGEKPNSLSVISLPMKPLLRAEMILEVTVQHVVSPNEFYVVVNGVPMCLCEQLLGSQRQSSAGCQEGNVMSSGLGAAQGPGDFEKLTTNLVKRLEAGLNWRKRQSDIYAEADLIAVRFVEKGTATWRRGKVISITINHREDEMLAYTGREIPWYEIMLLDTGETMIKRADQFCRLPLDFANHPTMAYHCSIANLKLTPFGFGFDIDEEEEEWSLEGLALFSKLVKGKSLYIQVVDTLEEFGRWQDVEMYPYKVDLFVPKEDIPQPELEKLEALAEVPPTVSVLEIMVAHGSGEKIDSSVETCLGYR